MVMYDRRSACGVTRLVIPTVRASRLTMVAALWRCMRLPQRLSNSGPAVRPSSAWSIASCVRGL